MRSAALLYARDDGCSLLSTASHQWPGAQRPWHVTFGESGVLSVLLVHSSWKGTVHFHKDEKPGGDMVQSRVIMDHGPALTGCGRRGGQDIWFTPCPQALRHSCCQTEGLGSCRIDEQTGAGARVGWIVDWYGRMTTARVRQMA
jgi:hypothetical protein